MNGLVSLEHAASLFVCSPTILRKWASHGRRRII